MEKVTPIFHKASHNLKIHLSYQKVPCGEYDRYFLKISSVTAILYHHHKIEDIKQQFCFPISRRQH